MKASTVGLGLVLVTGIAWLAWRPLAAPAAASASASASVSASAAAPPAATAFYAGRRPPVADLTALGRRLFSEAALSASGAIACVTCHDPQFAYGPRPGSPAKRGLRAIPSVRYQHRVPAFTLHMLEGEDGIDQGPAGGFMWDGRAASSHEQARLPLFSTEEMGNDSPAALVKRLRALPWSSEFTRVFGNDVFATDTSTVDAALKALEVFQQSPPDFSPYDSKFDVFLRGQTTLSPAEARGHALFDSKSKGNCASCHTSSITEGAFPAFTDFGFVALAVPLRPGDPPDHGLCGPLRTDLAQHPELCNLFRTPSLRNVAVRDRFFHNGAVTKLEDAVRFYATRDVTPARWAPSDRTNVHTEAPFGPKRSLTEPEIADLVAFLGTLTDGYVR